MRMLIQVQPPFPPQLNRSYGDFGYYNFGLCCWTYADPGSQFPVNFDGAIEWINTMNFCSEPKYPNPTSFRYWFNNGVTAIVTPRLQVTASAPDLTFNGVSYNMVSGKNMPLLLPAIP